MTQFYHARIAAHFVAQDPVASAGIAPNYPDYYHRTLGFEFAQAGFHPVPLAEPSAS